MRAEELKELLDLFRENPLGTKKWWRFASYKKGNDKDQVLLFRQGPNPRGICGTGKICGKPERTDEGKQTGRAYIHFEKLVDPNEGFLLSVEAIRDIQGIEKLVNSEKSGVRVPDDVAAELWRRLAPVC